MINRLVLRDRFFGNHGMSVAAIAHQAGLSESQVEQVMSKSLDDWLHVRTFSEELAKKVNRVFATDGTVNDRPGKRQTVKLHMVLSILKRQPVVTAPGVVEQIKKCGLNPPSIHYVHTILRHMAKQKLLSATVIDRRMPTVFRRRD